MHFGMVVYGKPVPQGSLTSFKHKYTGKIVTPQSPKVVAYRDLLAAAAREAGVHLLDGPITVHARFDLERPRSHWRANGELKDWAAALEPTNRVADADKLLRSCLDAMTGIAFDDDSQVVHSSTEKYYANERGGACTHLLIMEGRARSPFEYPGPRGKEFFFTRHGSPSPVG